MKSPLIAKGLAAFAVTAGLLLTNAAAQNLSLDGAAVPSWDFVAFETSGANPDDLDEITLAAHLFDAGSGVEIQILNNSVPGDGWVTAYVPTITSLYFEDRDTLLIAPSFNGAGSLGVVDYDLQSGGNLPGGTNIGFDTSFSFRAGRPPVVHGVDPNEVASFLFEGSVYEDVRNALDNGEIRIGAHVQQIGKCAEDSASYVTQVPEPGTSLLALLGSFLLLRRRR